jgi:hypothetical protein
MDMGKEERPCLISCGILRTEIEKLVKDGSLDVDIHFLHEELHNDYKLLGKALEGAIKKRLKDNPGRLIVVYGDVCLGFNNEMKALMHKHDVVKVDALNCIDCLLGGKGKLLEIDPEHVYYFLNPAFIRFSKRLKGSNKEETRKMFSMLKGFILLDSLGDLDDYEEKIQEICDYTGLKILERKDVGIESLKEVIFQAIKRLNVKLANTTAIK